VGHDASHDLGPRYAALLRELERRILVIDGAMGTLLQARNLGEADFRGERLRDWPRELKGNYDVLALSRPDVLEAAHREYLDAGADVVETNTFNANRFSQAPRWQPSRAGRAGWPAHSGRRTGPPRSRATSTTPAPAR